MKFSLSVLLVVACAGAAVAQNHYYLTGDNDPWFNTTNDDAMNLVFGKGGWTKDNFNKINAKDVFSDGTECVYLDGSDSNAQELDKFLQNNLGIIENWVSGGHGLFLNCAPNEGGSFNMGFGGVTLNYADFANNPSNDGGMGAHPIYNGPFTPVVNSYSGNAYAHATVSGGGLTGLMYDSDGGNPNLGELSWGGGTVVFGGLTTSNFWSPNGSGEAVNFRANIIDYVCRVPSPGAGAVLGLAGVAALRRRR